MFRLAALKPAQRRHILIYALLPLAYVICGRFGLLLAVPPGYATAVFVPAGIAVAAMYIAGPATLPGSFLGSFLLNIWISNSIAPGVDATGVASALVIALGSMVQAAIGGAGLRHFVGWPAPMDRPREVGLFLLLSPLFCATSATLSVGGLWLLGMVQGHDFISNWTTWWVGDSLGVLLGLPLILVVAGEPAVLWRARRAFVAAPMIACFAVFVAVFVRVREWENEQGLLEFRVQSHRIADTISASLDEHALFLEQLSSVFATRGSQPSRQEFRALVQTLIERFPTVQAVEWAPHVASAERGAVEAAQQAGLPGFIIRERAAAGELRPAADRAEFYPVTYLEPLAGNEQAAGFDLASDPNRRAAIDRAIASGHVAATAPIRLVQERGAEAGILLIDALPESAGKTGVVLVVLRMETFTAARAEPLEPTLNLSLADASAALPFFDSLPSSQMPAYTTGFDFGGRHYVVETAPSPAYLALHQGWQSWAVLVAGTLSTGLLGGLLLLGTGHTWRLEQLARKLGQSETRIAADLADMTRLNQLSNRLVRESGKVDRCLNEVVETAIAISGADKGNLQMFDAGSGTLTIAAQRGFNAPFLKYFEHVGDNASACAAAMRSGERVIVEDVTPSDIFAGQPSQQVLLDAGVRAVISVPLTSSGGNLLGMLSTHFGQPHRPSDRELRLIDLLGRQTADYLQRKRAEETERTLVHEIQHRSNNLLAVIQAIANQSLAGDGSLPQAKKAFEARLYALARVNRQLSTSNWSGMNLGEIVRLELEPFAGRAIIEGSNVVLGPRDAQSFSLALHELATNAAKYGALSSAGGKVGASWTIHIDGSGKLLKFRWQESGGPPVAAPTRRGFGTSLVKATFKNACFDFAAGGLRCEIDVMLGGMEPTEAARQEPLALDPSDT